MVLPSLSLSCRFQMIGLQTIKFMGSCTYFSLIPFCFLFLSLLSLISLFFLLLLPQYFYFLPPFHHPFHLLGSSCAPRLLSSITPSLIDRSLSNRNAPHFSPCYLNLHIHTPSTIYTYILMLDIMKWFERWGVEDILELSSDVMKYVIIED